MIWHTEPVGISPRQFAQMKSRLESPRPRPAPVSEPLSSIVPQSHRIILGIDPSLRGTGYGVIRLAKPHPVALAQGTIRCPSGWEHSRCLVFIAQTIRDLLRQHQPTVCVVEGLFYAQNLQTAIVLGEARGASLAAVAEAGLAIYELAPRKVKQAIVGYGAAQKSAVAKMVQRMLHLGQTPEADAADALALALALAQETGRYSLSPPRRI
jgi:crossover junction endodeoxyribonuclease RuvC